MNASEQIDKQIAGLSDWRGEVLGKLRKLILAADPNIVEEWKWDTGVWTNNGMVCAASAFKDHVKINFFRGAELEDFKNAFNGGLDSKKHRSIDFFATDVVDESKVKSIVRAAIKLNQNKKK